MTGHYIHNRESSRIELHFSKADYDALSSTEKANIKRNFLWSGKAGAWVSRATRSLYQPEQIAKALGLDNQGEEGERLSYAERLDAEKASAAERAERYADRADRAEQEVERRLQASHDAVKHIPLGQPILVGHHSERHHRADLARCRGHMDKAMEASQKAKHYRHRMSAAEHTANAEHGPAFCARRIEEAQTQIRDLTRRIQRHLQNEESDANTRHGEFLAERMTEEEEKQAYWEEQLAERGGVSFSRANVHKGDGVRIRRQWRRVVSANPKTVSVETGYTWTDRYPYAEITHLIPAAEIAAAEAKREAAALSEPPHPADDKNTATDLDSD